MRDSGPKTQMEKKKLLMRGPLNVAKLRIESHSFRINEKIREMTWKLMFSHGFCTRNIMKRLNASSHSSQLWRLQRQPRDVDL
jgi:hypothetical protein